MARAHCGSFEVDGESFIEGAKCIIALEPGVWILKPNNERKGKGMKVFQDQDFSTVE